MEKIFTEFLRDFDLFKFNSYIYIFDKDNREQTKDTNETTQKNDVSWLINYFI